MNHLFCNHKLWIFSDSADGVFGTGKARLLGEIGKSGSLSAAAKSLEISYRKAWADLKNAEQCLKLRLIMKVRGGKGGGKTTLTPEGKNFLKAYMRMNEKMDEHLEKCFKDFSAEFFSSAANRGRKKL